MPDGFEWAEKSTASEGRGDDGDEAEEGPDERFGVFNALRLA